MLLDVREKLAEVFNDAALEAISRLAYGNNANKLKFTMVPEPPDGADWIRCYIERPWKDFNKREHHDEIAKFTLKEFPDNGDIVVFNAAEVAGGLRMRGIGGFVHGLRLEACQKARVGAVMATVRSENEAERKILFAHGWHQTGQYTPWYTRKVPGREAERIEIWMKEL